MNAFESNEIGLLSDADLEKVKAEPFPVQQSFSRVK